MNIKANLAEHNLSLPELKPSAALFKGAVLSGKQVIVSGQLPLGFGELSQHVGQLGDNVSIEQGQKIAAICALNVLAQADTLVGLENIKSCLKITVFVNSVAGFNQQHMVANGASEVMLKAFGAESHHARSAIGVSQLPFGVAVEVEALLEVL